MYRYLYRFIRIARPREFLSLKYLRELERSQWLSQDELQHVAWQKLKRLLDHAYENVPFYRQRFQRMGITPQGIQTREDFSQFPLLSKHDIRVHGDDLIAQNYAKSRMQRDSTSGSTGIPIVVYHDHHYDPIGYAAVTRSRRWFGVEPGDKGAWIWGRRDDVPADTWSARLTTAIKRERWLNAFRVSDEEMQRFAEKLVEWQPDYLAGYVTSVYFFAHHVSSHHITGIRLKAVETTAETLWPHQRQMIEKTFNCQVFDNYSSHEAGYISAECRHGRMHIFCDVCYIEVLTGDGRPSEGGIGEIVVTPLYSYGMPLVRFRIGDVGVLNTEPCPCGRGLPVLREVVGRVNSFITLPSGKYLHSRIFPTILDDILEIQQFRIHQSAKDELEILLERGDGFSQQTIDLVRTRATKLLGDEPVKISIRATDEILPTASGKYLVVSSDVPPDFMKRT
jgi:phenylacetate-CoA ligase